MTDAGSWRLRARHWEIGEDRAEEFRRLGLPRRNFFPHQVRYLPVQGVDGYRIAKRMYGLDDPGAHFAVVLHAVGPALRRIPAELFVCRDVTWHQRHYGLPGHTAVAGLVLHGERLYTTVRISDIVQRISRRREHKTAVEHLLHGWDDMLLNGIVHFAGERGCREIVLPSADLALVHTARNRTPQRPLFDRIYDRHVQRFAPRREGETWIIDVATAQAGLVRPTEAATELDLTDTICIEHDIEGGLGHLEVDPAFAEIASRNAAPHLAAMLEAESRAGVRTTYHVVGTMLDDVRRDIEGAGHGLGFHSYDHRDEPDQLVRCRRLDYRLRGYRAPRSRITDELTDPLLAWHNFEWFSSSVRSLGLKSPLLRSGIAVLPIATDDFPLYRRSMPYAEWRDDLFTRMGRQPWFAFGLHDCYAGFWLAEYDDLLRRCADRGTLRTFGDVVDAMVLAAAV